MGTLRSHLRYAAKQVRFASALAVASALADPGVALAEHVLEVPESCGTLAELQRELDSLRGVDGGGSLSASVRLTPDGDAFQLEVARPTGTRSLRDGDCRSSETRASWFPWAIALAGGALTLGACVDGIVGQIEVCQVDGRSYVAGQSFASSDGCNACTCLLDGRVSCTERACEELLVDGGQVDTGSTEPGPMDGGLDPSCLIGDRWHAQAVPFLAPDGCNACICTSEGLACTDKDCGADAGSAPLCRDGQSVHAVGTSYSSEDGSSTCVCQPDGVSLCKPTGCDGGFSDGGEFHSDR